MSHKSNILNHIENDFQIKCFDLHEFHSMKDQVLKKSLN